MILSGVFFRKQDTAGRKSLFMPVNRSVPEVAQKRKDWNGLISGFKARTLDALPNAIQNVFHAVTVSDCSGWFRFCGYAL